jgi:hypothetical protein
MIITCPRSKRRAVQQAYIEAHLPLPWLDFDYQYIGATPYNDSEQHFLAYPPGLSERVVATWRWLGQVNQDITCKDFFAFAFHVESRVNWMLRITDDTVINFQRLPDYVRALDRQYDATVDQVVRSNCLNFYGTRYPQGGSGALFSLAASTKLAPGLEEMIGGWREAEDISLGTYIDNKGIPMTDTADPAFIGLGWTSSEEFMVAWQNVSAPCPVQTLGRLRDVVFYHAQGWRPETGDAQKITTLVYNAAPNVLYYLRGARPQICTAANV